MFIVEDLPCNVVPISPTGCGTVVTERSVDQLHSHIIRLHHCNMLTLTQKYE